MKEYEMEVWVRDTAWAIAANAGLNHDQIPFVMNALRDRAKYLPEGLDKGVGEMSKE